VRKRRWAQEQHTATRGPGVGFANVGQNDRVEGDTIDFPDSWLAALQPRRTGRRGWAYAVTGDDVESVAAARRAHGAEISAVLDNPLSDSTLVHRARSQALTVEAVGARMAIDSQVIWQVSPVLRAEECVRLLGLPAAAAAGVASADGRIVYGHQLAPGGRERALISTATAADLGITPDEIWRVHYDFLDHLRRLLSFADEATWAMGALERGKHLMPWRIEDELKAIGANYIQAGLWRDFAVRDGNLITSASNAQLLAGPLMFTTTTTPGVAMDGIFYWSGKGLNWDPYAHNPASSDPVAKLPCHPDSNGYNTGDPTAINYYEWCQDHNKPLETAPFGDVAGKGPATLPDANILTNGAWYGGSAYLGPNATGRAVGPTGTTPPSGTIANSPTSEAGFAFMWHSHNEREITTNNIFPGGMMMMMLVDSREYPIDESN